MTLLLRWWLLALLATVWTAGGQAASVPEHEFCGTYPGRVLTEVARHRQYVNQRVQQGFVPQTVSTAAPTDIGSIAVLPDDGTLVIPANFFDLSQRSVLIRPAGAAYTVAAGGPAFDPAAAAAGILLNPPPASNPDNIGDDGTRQVPLGFAFPYFGSVYTSVFINSDGNLTFTEGDTAITQRSLARFLAGPPRIAPYFADLDPSVAGQLTYLSSGSRFVVTWNQVPDFARSGVGPRETFQVILSADGSIQFSYDAINGRESVIGISPGRFSGPSNLLDLSGTGTGTTVTGPVAEIFTATTDLDLAAVTQRFYSTHEDAYDFLIVFTNFDFDLGNAFAFELNIQNQVTGIGRISDPPVFDFSREFGSSRLQSLVNMGNLLRYPADPSRVFLRGVDSSLSVLGQEAGHRFLAYVNWEDPQGAAQSTALLGRDLQHWSFLFNSEASVLEGNRIRDNRDGTFVTTGAVERYSELDQYLMGLRPPQEVAPTFLVKDSNPAINPARAPAVGVNFSGLRADVVVEQIIAANGPRLPNSVISQKIYNFAFLLVIPRGASVRTEHVAQLDLLRQSWEPFFAAGTSSLGGARTGLVRGLRLTLSALGLLAGSQFQGEVELLSPATADVVVSLRSSNPSAVGAPSQVMIPAGAKSARFPITALSPGRSVLTATAPGFETSEAVVEVFAAASAANLSLAITGGNLQTGKPGTTLARPLQVTLRDSNQIPLAGAGVEFTVVAGEATVSPSGTATDGRGNASTLVTLGEQPGPVTVVAAVPGTNLSTRFSLFSAGVPEVPQGGVVNGASFAPGTSAVSPGSILSIFGQNLAASIAAAQALPLPVNLANASVEIGGVAAPLFYVSPAQINAQVPFQLSGSTASVVIRSGGASSVPVSIALQAAAPGIFSRDASGRGPGAITHATSHLPVEATAPARAGDFVQIFATGLGSVAPPVASGAAGPSLPLSLTTFPVTVTMGGRPAPVVFSGLAPGFAGVYQVNAQVPEGISGTAEVVLTVNGVASNAVSLEVQ